MYYWQHFGPRCASSGASIEIKPLNTSQPTVRIVVAMAGTPKAGRIDGYQFSDRREYYRTFAAGLLEGIRTPLQYPIADIEIVVLALIEHEVDSSEIAFKDLGQWVAEALVKEMYRQSTIGGRVRYPSGR
jgi:hypothetical protein